MTTQSPPALVLASASPRRQGLLAELNIPFTVQVSEIAEDFNPTLDTATQAITLAEQKARAVAVTHSAGLVIGADTIVALSGELLGKPTDDDDAAAMLRRLSGREHQVVTGLALADAATGQCHRRAVTSSVIFRQLDDHEIAAYVATGEPHDKAGAYAIQGLGANLIARFTGCYANIVGLPLCGVAALLAETGAPLPAQTIVCRLPGGAPCPNLV